MSTYPGGLVAFTTKTNKVDTVDADHINIIQGEITGMQTAFGTNIAGSKATLNARLAVCFETSGALCQSNGFPGSAIRGQMFWYTVEDALYIYDGAMWDNMLSVADNAIGTAKLVNTSVTRDKLAVFERNCEIFTTNGIFTAPTGVTYVWVSAVGGGGGGGGHTDGQNSGGGGGGGGNAILKACISVTPGNTYPIVVGNGGLGGSHGGSADGSDGGNTTFNTTIVVAYGGGGGKGSGGVPRAGGIAPIQSGTGEPGQQTYGAAGGIYACIQGGVGGSGGISSVGGGGGGASAMGKGAQGGWDNASHYNGYNCSTSSLGFGGGGGGGVGDGYYGGSGAQGICIVEWGAFIQTT